MRPAWSGRVHRKGVPVPHSTTHVTVQAATRIAQKGFAAGGAARQAFSAS